MPNEGMKISQLPAATEVLDSDVVAGVGGGVTRKFTFATIASYISTKLTALFDAKQNKITATGVLQGDGDGGVTAKTVDSTPTASSTNLITSGGVKSALDNPGTIDLGTFTTLSDLEAKLDAQLAEMASNSTASIRVTAGASVAPFANTYIYYGALAKSGVSGSFASAILTPSGQTNAVLCRRSTTGWTFEKILTGWGSRNYYTIPANSSLSFSFTLYAQAIIYFIGYSTAAIGAFLLSRASSSVLIQVPLASASALTISMDSDGIVTITSTSSSSVNMFLTVFQGTILEVT